MDSEACLTVGELLAGVLAGVLAGAEVGMHCSMKSTVLRAHLIVPG